MITLAIPCPSPSAIHRPINFTKKNWRFCILKKIQVFPGPSLHLSFALFCCCWKYTETSIILVKLIGQWIPDGNGRGIARDIKKNCLYCQNLSKMVTKFGQFKKLKCREGSNFVNCPNIVTIFCWVLKMKIIFLISLAIIRPSPSEIHWPINFTNKIDASVYFQKKLQV